MFGRKENLDLCRWLLCRNTCRCCIYPQLWWNREAHKAKQRVMISNSSYPHLNLPMFAALTVNCAHAVTWTFYQDAAGRPPDEGPNEASPCLSAKGQWTHTHTLISPFLKCQGPVWGQRNAPSPFIHWNMKHNNKPGHYPLWQTGQEWKVVLKGILCFILSNRDICFMIHDVPLQVWVHHE